MTIKYIESKNKACILLIVLFTCGIIYKLVNAYFNIVRPDEAYYTYDSYLILKGYIPFIDYSTRAPVLLYMLAAFIKVFGTTIFASRLLSFVASIVTIGFVYKMGEQLYTRRIGILASLIFIFSPFIAYWGCGIVTEPVQVMFITISMYLLILGVKTRKYRYLILNGVFLLLAVLVRRSACIFILTEPFFILLSHRLLTGDAWKIKESLKEVGAMLVGLSLPILPVIIYLYYIGEFNAAFTYINPSINTILSIPQIGIVQYSGILTDLVKKSLYLVIPTLLFIVLALKTFISEKYRFWYKIYVSGIGLICLGVFFRSLLTDKLFSVLFNATLVIPIILILLSNDYTSKKLYEWFGKSYKKVVYTLSLAYVLFVLLIYTAVGNFLVPHTWWSFQETISLFSIVLVMALIYPTIILAKSINITADKKAIFSSVFLLFWFFSVFLFYLIRNLWSPVYYYEYAAVASIMSAVFLYSAYKEHSKEIKKVFYIFILILIISGGFSQMLYAIGDTPVPYPEQQQSIFTIREVSGYISSHTSEDEEIFTAWPIYAFQTDRKICFNIVRSYKYHHTDHPVSNHYPSIEQLISHFESEKTRYILVEFYMKFYMFAEHPELEEYIYSHYTLEKTIGNVYIYRRHSDTMEVTG